MKEVNIKVEDEYLTRANALYLRDIIMNALIDNGNSRRLTINLRLSKSRLKLVFYIRKPLLDIMNYVDEFINNLLGLRKRREVFSHSRDHKISMYYFLNNVHCQDRIRI